MLLKGPHPHSYWFPTSCHARHKQFVSNRRYTQLPHQPLENCNKQKYSQAAPSFSPLVPNASLHQTLNHRSKEALEHFLKEYPQALKYIVNKGKQMESFDPCIKGKAKRAEFKHLSTNRHAPLDAFSTNTTGPLSEADIAGNKYLQMIFDAETGWTYVQPMKTKDEATKVIHKAIARLQLSCARPVKRLHSDGAHEQYCGKLKEFLDNQGNIKSTTAPNNSVSNAMVDRRLGIIFSTARTALASAPPPLNQAISWSFAGLEAIDKSKYLPFRRDGQLAASPHTQMGLHVRRTARQSTKKKDNKFSYRLGK